MRIPMLLSLVLAAGTASAEPRQMSQHPRVGELTQIAFSQRSARISVDNNQQLGEIAGWARDNPDGLIVLDGHAAKGEGNPEQLSQQRAESVRNELVAIGVDPDQIVIAAFGDAGPARDARSRVIVWGTHDELAVVLTRLEQAGARNIEEGSRQNGRRPEVPRPTLAGR
jgi:outer membrane protein OmpA-like peptidoglycan-associated protein